MQEQIERTLITLDAVTTEAHKLFGNLTVLQLNWKPAPEKWSIAQCLDHLIVSNNTYYPQFNAIITRKYRNSLYQNIGFISRWFGNYLIRKTGPVVGKPMKNPPAFAPAQSNLPATIVADFNKQQLQLSAVIAKLDDADLNKTIVSSPAQGLITYSLHDLLIILAGHEQRHLQQAKNVLQHPQFPG